MRRSVWTALLSAMGLLLVAAVGLLVPSSASAYPTTECASIAVSATTVTPGETITVTGKKFDGLVTVTLTLYPKDNPSATTLTKDVTTLADGTFTTTITMPLSARGNQILTSSGLAAGCPADPIQIFVPGPGASGSPTGSGTGPHTPAMTGVDVALLIAAGAALIGAGFVFTRGGRRRANHS